MDGGETYQILLYHGVYPEGLPLEGRNSSGKHMASDRFEREMSYLAANVPLVTNRQIAAAHAGGVSLPDGAVAVNFDDGYLNNYTTAWPILERHGIPATVYLATGFIGTGRMIWGDCLEAGFLGTLKDRIDLCVMGRHFALPLNNIAERQHAFNEVKNFGKLIANEDKDRMVEEVIDHLECEFEEGHPLFDFMAWDDAREMNESGLIDFGAHTVDHISLAKVSDEEMHRQIDESMETLTRELGQDCDLFSYPEGQEHDYNEAVIDHLRKRGLDHAPTAIEGVNRIGETGPFDIRRSMVGFNDMPFPFETE